ncbi:ComF family protein [Catenovulum agarivorans]|uniref:ComF family protein n=1 Tax=Catenovulum agarivorans TaxID=1172192 RepID=UPI0002D4679A|nr:phosphoribosyltransferase family protein [Catenovulum agarivorans]
MELQNYFNGFKKLSAILTQVHKKLPSRCLACNSATQARHLVCQYCVNDWQQGANYLAWSDITTLLDAQKSMQIDELEHIFCLAEHTTPIANLITQYKYQRDLTARTALSQLLSASFADSELSQLGDLSKFDYLIPVPMHYSALWFRGFNQSAWLAQQFSIYSQVPVLHALQKTKATKHQAKLTGQARRLHKQDIYAVKSQFIQQVKEKRLLLVDDVITTGATLNSLAACLLEYEVASVSAVTVSWAKLG